MPSNESASWGARCERAAASKYGLRREMGTGYDLISPANGTKYQVKSADVDRERPRFRFWLADHAHLYTEYQACYIVVLYSSRANRVKKIQKVPLGRVASAADWGPAGHKGKSGKQAKVDVDELL